MNGFLKTLGWRAFDLRSGSWCLAFFVTTFALAWGGIELSQAHGIAAIWLADAIVLLALIRVPKRQWPLYIALALAACFLGNHVHRHDILVSLVLPLCNLTSLTMAAFLLSRIWRDTPQLSRPRTLIEFCIVGGAFAPMVSASMATAFLSLTYGADPVPLWRTWFLGCALGILALGPLFLSARAQHLGSLMKSPFMPEVAGVIALILAVDVVVFTLDDQAYACLIFPALLLAAFRLRFTGLTVMAVLTVMIALGMTLGGFGPFQHDAERTLAQQVQLLQLILAGAILTSLPVASALAERERLQRRLQGAVDDARNASGAKSEFLASMSHELRTPLNAVIGFAQFLLIDKTANSERRAEYLGYIQRSGNQLLALINDVLDFAKIEAGDIRMAVEDVEVPTLLKEAAEILKPLAVDRHLELVVEIDQDSAQVMADRARLMQVLLNLGSNAIKYNRPKGTVRFKTGAFGEAMMRITVSDTGVGIPASRQREVFQPFNRLGAEAGPIEGTGIGLSICWQLVRAMGGHIGFASERGQGSDFWIDLPKSAANASQADHTAERLGAPGRQAAG